MKRKFLYHLRTYRKGPLLYGEGESWEEAARAAGLEPAQVKRAMPVKAILTEEEKEARRLRFEALRHRKEQENG